MKTFMRGILTTILVFTFTLIPIVIYTEKTINNDVIGNYVKEELIVELTETITDNINEVTEEDYNTIKNTIKDDEEINDLIEKYSNRVIKDLSTEKIEALNIEEDIKKLLQENKDLIEKSIQTEINEEEYNQLIEEVLESEALNSFYHQTIKEAKNGLSSAEKTILNSYNTLTSNEFIILLSMISLVAIIIIALLKKPYYKWIVNIAIAGMISALFIMLIGGCISLLANVVIDSYKTMEKVSAAPILITAGIMIIVSIMLIIINAILDKRKESSHAVS